MLNVPVSRWLTACIHVYARKLQAVWHLSSLYNCKMIHTSIWWYAVSALLLWWHWYRL